MTTQVPVPAAGIDCGADCTEEYATGTEVTLTAAPAAGSWRMQRQLHFLH